MAEDEHTLQQLKGCSGFLEIYLVRHELPKSGMRAVCDLGLKPLTILFFDFRY